MQGSGPDLSYVERPQFAIRDTTGERLARLAQQFDARGPEEKELCRAISRAYASVDDSAKGSEQVRGKLHFVKDQQVGFVQVAE